MNRLFDTLRPFQARPTDAQGHPGEVRHEPR